MSAHPSVVRAVLTLALTVGAGDAFANGGPVYVEPELGGRGGIIPLEESVIRLESEQLNLTLLHAFGWRARAEYVLVNPGPERTILFGVPTSWRAYAFLGAPPAPPDSMLDGARRIRITLSGKELPCEPRLGASNWPAGTRVEPVEAWCVARMKVPSGESIPLTLEYEGIAIPLLPWGSLSRASYTLAPAGYWHGRAHRVSIEVDPRQFAGRTKMVWPADAREVDGKIRWEGTDVDLRKLRSVVVDYDSGRRRLIDGGWLRVAVPLTATASSVLRAQGKHDYAASNAVDGDRSTAWCEGVPGQGIGQSLSVAVALPQSEDRECKLLEVELVPGLASDEAAYRANGRLLAGRLERCDGPAEGVDFQLAAKERDYNVWPTLADNDHAGDPPQEIGMPPGALGPDPACVRLVIKQVRAGAKYADTCVSEFTPRVYCRARSAPVGTDSGSRN